jgi:hypothetical protein
MIFSGIKEGKQEFWRRVEPKEPDQIGSNRSDLNTRRYEKAQDRDEDQEDSRGGRLVPLRLASLT